MSLIDGHWQLGIGDPTPMGWATVVAYAAASWGCWRAACADSDERAAATRFWLVAALALALLGLNKQLDLQTALTDVGRALAHREGWYDRRRAAQIAFIVAAGLAGAATLWAVGRLARPWSIGRATALGGLVFLGTFVLVRASSFHHVDLLLSAEVLGWKGNWIFELSGIGLTACGAAIELRNPR